MHCDLIFNTPFSLSMEKNELIELVRHEKTLWDQRHKNYRNRDIKPALWDKIGKELNVTGKQAQKTWESLRDVYRRHLKEETKLKSRDELKARNKWKYFERMDFVRSVTTSRQSFGKLQFPEQSSHSSTPSPFIEEGIPPVILAENEYLGEDTRHEHHNNISSTKDEAANETFFRGKGDRPYKKIEKKQLYANKAPEMEYQKLQVPERRIEQNSDMSEDEDYLFFKSLLPSIKKLNDLQKMHLKMEFLSSLTKKLEENR